MAFYFTANYAVAYAAVFVLRRHEPQAERPYRCWGYPVVPAVYVLILASVVVNTFINQRTESLVGVSFIVVGALVYTRIERRDEKPSGKHLEQKSGAAL